MLLYLRALKTDIPPNSGRLNNYDLLRIVLASIVIVSHSYPLYGLEHGDWIIQLTGDKWSFGSLGVGGFLAISGCLVFQSSQRTSNYSSFIRKRFLRIYPGLLVNALVSALILGPLIIGSLNYYTDSAPYTYIARTLGLINLQWCIGDVFKNNPYGCFINGSLWTIAYEFLFYVMFFIPYCIPWINRNMKGVASVLFCSLLVIKITYPDIGYDIPFTRIHLRELTTFGIWFSGGVLLGATMQYWQKFKVAIALASFTVGALVIGGFLIFQLIFICLPLFVISFGICRTPVVSSLQKYGDPSYGIYIYGFVVQQTLIYYFGKSLSFYGFMGMSLLVSIAMGYISWFLVEKRMLHYGRKHVVQVDLQSSLRA